MNLLIFDPDYSFYKAVKAAFDSLGEKIELFHFSKTEGWRNLYQAELIKRGLVIPEEPEPATEGAAANEAEQRAHYEIELMLNHETSELIGILNMDSESFMGYGRERLLKHRLFWRTLIDISDRSRFNGFLNSIKDPELVKNSFLMRDTWRRAFRADVQSKIVKSADGVECVYIKFSCDLEAEKKEDGDSKEQKVDESGRVQLAFVNWDLVSSSAKNLIENLKKEIDSQNLDYGGGSAGILFSSHDTPNIDFKLVLSLDSDVLFKPLDELMFLQKTIMYVPQLAKSAGAQKFLYTADTNMPVELGVEYTVSALSESGFQVRSRAPLKVGSKVKVYSDKFGAESRDGLFAQGFEMQRPQEGHSHYLTSYSFFGLHPANLRHFREFMGIHKEAPLPEPKKEDSAKKAKGPKIHGQEAGEVEKRRILLVDLDAENAAKLSEMIDRQMPDYKLESFDSLKYMIRQLDPEKRAEDHNSGANQPWEMRPAFFPKGPLTAYFDVSTGSFVRFKDENVNNGLVFGYERASVATTPDFWQECLPKKDRPGFKDFIYFLASGQTAEKKLCFNSKFETTHFIGVSGRRVHEAGGDFVAIEFKDLTEMAREVGKSQNEAVHNRHLGLTDAVFVDYSFFAESPLEDYHQLHTALQVATGRENTPVFLVGRDQPMDRLLPLTKIDAQDLFFKPLDRGHLLRKLLVAIGAIRPQPDKPVEPLEVFRSTEGWLDIARPIQVTGIGEYGLQFNHTAALPVGSWGHFYHPQLNDSSGRGILAKCYKTVALEKNVHKCFFMFVGIREQRLKNLRVYIKSLAAAAAAGGS